MYFCIDHVLWDECRPKSWLDSCLGCGSICTDRRKIPGNLCKHCGKKICPVCGYCPFCGLRGETIDSYQHAHDDPGCSG